MQVLHGAELRTGRERSFKDISISNTIVKIISNLVVLVFHSGEVCELTSSSKLEVD